MARGGFFRRIVSAVRDFFAEEEPSRATPAPRVDRDRQRARERDPYLRDWDAHNLHRTGFMQHKDIVEDMAATYNLDRDEELEMWNDYLTHIVGKRGVRAPYRRNDIRNPFWQKWGIDPEEDFDWSAWREAFGDSPKAGRG